MVFSFHIETDQFEDDEENILIMQLKIANQFIRGIGKEALKAVKKRIVITALHLVHKLHDLERRITDLNIGIIRQQIFDEAFLYLFIGKT